VKQSKKLGNDSVIKQNSKNRSRLKIQNGMPMLTKVICFLGLGWQLSCAVVFFVFLFASVQGNEVGFRFSGLPLKLGLVKDVLAVMTSELGLLIDMDVDVDIDVRVVIAGWRKWVMSNVNKLMSAPMYYVYAPPKT